LIDINMQARLLPDAEEYVFGSFHVNGSYGVIACDGIISRIFYRI
jgi:hypothetical protein